MRLNKKYVRWTAYRQVKEFAQKYDVTPRDIQRLFRGWSFVQIAGYLASKKPKLIVKERSLFGTPSGAFMAPLSSVIMGLSDPVEKRTMQLR